jgi:glycosyltransferase involved in cell wall biosynthesis
VIDAMADGVPVLASNIGGLPELVGEHGLVRPGGASAWGEALAKLWRDPELRQIRGLEALGRARERLGEDRYYTRLMEIYAPSP